MKNAILFSLAMATLMLGFNACQGDKLMVPYPDEPVVSLSDEDIDFGRQVFGETAEQTFIVRNEGARGHRLHLYYFVEDDRHFSATRSDQHLTLEVGEAWQTRVRFHAVRAGHHQTNLILFLSHYPLEEDRMVTRHDIALDGEARVFCAFPELSGEPLEEADWEGRLSGSPDPGQP